MSCLVAGTSRFSCWASNFKSSLAQWTRVQAVILINKIINEDKQEVAPGKQNVTAASPKDKLEFNNFLRALSWGYRYTDLQNLLCVAAETASMLSSSPWRYGFPTARLVPSFINVSLPVMVAMGWGNGVEVTLKKYTLPTLCLSFLE